jgi:hypothetical protein
MAAIATEACPPNAGQVSAERGEQRSRAGLPNPRRVILGRRDDAAAVRTELGVLHSQIMVQNGYLLRGVGSPDSRGVIRRSRHKALAIGAKAGTQQNMSGDRRRLCDLRAARAVPELRTFGDRQYPLAVRAEQSAVHIDYAFTFVARIFENFLTALGIPYTCRLVPG